MSVFKIAQKLQNIWASLGRFFLQKPFKTGPIWSHWKDGMGEFEIWSAATLGDKYEQVVQEGDFDAPSGKNEQ